MADSDANGTLTQDTDTNRKWEIRDGVIRFDPAHYEKLMEGMVRDFAPSRFAILQDVGDYENGWVAAWGLATEVDEFQVMDVRFGAYSRVTDLEPVLRDYAREPGITARLRWIDPQPVAEFAEDAGDDVA